MKKRKVKIPEFISTPKDKGWKDMTYPQKELTNKQIMKSLKRKNK